MISGEWEAALAPGAGWYLMRRQSDGTLRAAAYYGPADMTIVVRCAQLLNRHGLDDVPLDQLEPM